MTAILAYREGRNAWIGGDGEVSWGDTKIASTDPKVWRPRPGVLAGAAGGLAWCEAVAWLSWPGPKDLDDAWIRKHLAQSICRRLSDEQRDGHALVVACGRIYMVEPGGVCVVKDHWGAVGCGSREALSACAAASHLKGGERVRTALEIAGRYASGVGPPYLVLKA